MVIIVIVNINGAPSPLYDWYFGALHDCSAEKRPVALKGTLPSHPGPRPLRVWEG